MKDVATPATQSEVRGTIKEALTKAALVNYERLSEEARIEGKPDISKNIHNLSIVDLFRSIFLLYGEFDDEPNYDKCFIFYAADRQNNQGKLLKYRKVISR